MGCKKISWIIGTCVVLGAIGIIWASTRNVAPDAVTKATQGYNVYQGELSYLTDGKYPGNSEAPGFFQWENKGDLVFELPEPVNITEVRIYVGEPAGSFTATFLLGAKLGPDGQTFEPKGEKKGEAENYKFLTNQWVSLKPETPVTADCVVVSTMGGPKIYEIQILAEEGALVQPSSWGYIKSKFSH